MSHPEAEPLHVVASIAGALCLAAVFVDAFQTILLPRRPTGRYRITRGFLILTWQQWRVLASRTKDRKAREQILSVYGPLSLILLLFLWAMLLVFGFGLFYYALSTPFTDVMGVQSAHGLSEFRTDL